MLDTRAPLNWTVTKVTRSVLRVEQAQAGGRVKGQIRGQQCG